MKIRLGDEILVIKGKDKGKKGKVEKVFPTEQKIMALGINVYKKHQKASGEKKPGGIIDLPKPISVANVKLLCPKCNQPARIGFSIGKDGRKYRQCRKCKQIIDKD